MCKNSVFRRTYQRASIRHRDCHNISGCETHSRPQHASPSLTCQNKVAGRDTFNRNLTTPSQDHRSTGQAVMRERLVALDDQAAWSALHVSKVPDQALAPAVHSIVLPLVNVEHRLCDRVQRIALAWRRLWYSDQERKPDLPQPLSDDVVV